MNDEPQGFPQYQPPVMHNAHPQQAKILLKVFKAFGKRGRGNSLTIRKRKKAKVI